jgi:hypothetical protein
VPTTSGLAGPCGVVGVVWDVDVGCVEGTGRLILNRCEGLFVKKNDAERPLKLML